MANSHLKIILAQILQAMEDNTFACSPEEEAEAIQALSNIVINKNTPLTRSTASEYLHMSMPTFDRKVADNILPQGRKIKGIKELVWYRSDFDHYLKQSR